MNVLESISSVNALLIGHLILQSELVTSSQCWGAGAGSRYFLQKAGSGAVKSYLVETVKVSYKRRTEPGPFRAGKINS